MSNPDPDRPKRILVVDDSAPELELIQEFLGTRDFVFETSMSVSGAQVIVAKAEPFDAIIVDYDLGGVIDGLAAIRAFRCTLPNAVYVLNTGNPSPEVRKRCLSSNVVHVEKSYDPNHLSNIVRRLLGLDQTD